MRDAAKALAVFDDGTGESLYVGGAFTSVGGLPVNGAAKWDGSRWWALGSGITNVSAWAVFDDGGGPALYAGGNFTTAGGSAASRIARWDGTSWSSLNGGMNATVWALTTFDPGSGAQLVAGGNFTSAGGVIGRDRGFLVESVCARLPRLPPVASGSQLSGPSPRPR